MATLRTQHNRQRLGGWPPAFRETGYPKALRQTEVRGLPFGPYGYWRSRRHAAALDRTP